MDQTTDPPPGPPQEAAPPVPGEVGTGSGACVAEELEKTWRRLRVAGVLHLWHDADKEEARGRPQRPADLARGCCSDVDWRTGRRPRFIAFHCSSLRRHGDWAKLIWQPQTCWSLLGGPTNKMRGVFLGYGQGHNLGPNCLRLPVT